MARTLRVAADMSDDSAVRALVTRTFAPWPQVDVYASSTSTGAWSLGALPLRSSRTISA
jgi:hypothetical protein